MSKKMLFLLALVTLAWPTAASADIESLLAAGVPVKCATPYLMENPSAESTLKITASYRTTGMQHSLLSPSGHFRIHYNTTVIDTVDTTDKSGNGIPDYVDSALVYLEYAYNFQVNVLGFDPPMSDGSQGGGPELDIYLKNLSGIYGQTYSVTSLRVGKTTPAYIEIDNDFREPIYASHGYDALKVTTAHELFHAVQFRFYYDLDLNWWQEQSAVWMEDILWDQVNDYFAYLRFFFQKKDTPLDSRDGSFEYGAVVWPQYLSKRFGQDIIPAIWRKIGTTGSNKISEFDSVIPGGLAKALAEFAVWNYFTKERGNAADFFNDSPLFPVGIETDTSVSKSPAQGSQSTPHLTSRYIELLFSGQWDRDDFLRVAITPSSPGVYENRIIFYNSPTDYRIYQLSSLTEDVPLDGLWDRAILVSSCISTQRTATYYYEFSTEVVTHSDEPLAFILRETYPNPFNISTTVSFTIPDQGGMVTVKAFNSLGQEVAELFKGRLNGGETRVIWQPGDLAGGLYFITISGPWGTKTVKTTFLK